MKKRHQDAFLGVRQESNIRRALGGRAGVKREGMQKGMKDAIVTQDRR